MDTKQVNATGGRIAGRAGAEKGTAAGQVMAQETGQVRQPDIITANAIQREELWARAGELLWSVIYQPGRSARQRQRMLRRLERVLRKCYGLGGKADRE